jgi:micrococcal nuclease
MKRLALIIAFALAAFSAAVVAGDTVTVTRVIDGDTIRVWDGEREFPIRLIGVDTPELSLNRKTARDAETWGKSTGEIIEAGKTARGFVLAVAPPGIELRIDADGQDMYGRDLAYAYLPDGQCLNEALVRNGYAIVPKRYPNRYRDRYAAMEGEAKRLGRGFWPTLWGNQNRQGESQ